MSTELGREISGGSIKWQINWDLGIIFRVIVIYLGCPEIFKEANKNVDTLKKNQIFET